MGHRKGTPKTGGRQKGTPNKINESKAPYIEKQEDAYFTEVGSDGKTQFERDMAELSPFERVTTHVRLLKYVKPELKAIDMSATVENKKTIEDTLNELAEE